MRTREILELYPELDTHAYEEVHGLQRVQKYLDRAIGRIQGNPIAHAATQPAAETPDAQADSMASMGKKIVSVVKHVATYPVRHPLITSGGLIGLAAAGIVAKQVYSTVTRDQTQNVEKTSESTVTGKNEQIVVLPSPADVTVQKTPLAVLPDTPVSVVPTQPSSQVTIAHPTAQISQAVQTAVVPEVKPFEMLFSEGTSEQIKTSYTKIAQDDWNAVMKAYGLNETDGRLEIGIGNGYNVVYRVGDRIGTGGEANLGDFTEDPNDRGLKHPMGHAVNYVLISNDIPSWLDEGLAMYGSGEVKDAVAFAQSHGGNFFHSTVRRTDNPGQYWVEAKSFVPSHIVGVHLYGLMAMDYGLTPEKNQVAVRELGGIRKSKGSELALTDVRNVYERVLGRDLNGLFSFIETGIKTVY